MWVLRVLEPGTLRNSKSVSILAEVEDNFAGNHANSPAVSVPR